jgi:hypothetical protein
MPIGKMTNDPGPTVRNGEPVPSWPVEYLTEEEMVRLYPEPRLYTGTFRKIDFNSKDYGVVGICSQDEDS